MSHRTLHGCQHCSATDLRTVIFLGFQPPPNLMMEVGQAAGELAVFPNELAVCNA